MLKMKKDKKCGIDFFGKIYPYSLIIYISTLVCKRQYEVPYKTCIGNESQSCRYNNNPSKWIGKKVYPTLCILCIFIFESITSIDQMMLYKSYEPYLYH